MPNLSCNVCNCNHNSEGLCCLNGIDVFGDNTKENTCCSNFSDCQLSENSINQYASAQTDVKCEAQDCKHNHSCKCSANSIDICSCGSACECEDTQCSSFSKR